VKTKVTQQVAQRRGMDLEKGKAVEQQLFLSPKLQTLFSVHSMVVISVGEGTAA
jgi:hypothetical protein